MLSRGCATKINFVAVLLTLLVARVALASEPTFRILGVIASTQADSGVALIKNLSNDKAFAARVGEKFEKDVFIRTVARDKVELQVKDKVYLLGVGEDTGSSREIAMSTANTLAQGGIELKGDTAVVSSTTRDRLVKDNLNEILMQAAAVPYYRDGSLAGFRLWDIEHNSVFEHVGLRDGDIITQINGQALNDVGKTIKMLMTLKTEAKAEVAYIRNGAEQTLNVVIQ